MDRALASGTGRVIAALGPSGTGKGSALDALGRSHEADQPSRAWIRVQARADTQREPHHVLAQAVKRSAGIPSDVPLVQANELLCSWAQRFGDRADIAAWCIAQTLGIPLPTQLRPADAPRTSEGVQARTYALLREDMIRVATERGLVLLVRDAQWADGPSLRFLTELVGQGVPIVLLVSASSTTSDLPKWLVGLDAHLLAVPSLTDADAAHIVAEQTAPLPLSKALVHRVVSASEGHCWALLEALRLLPQAGLLIPREAGWEVRESADLDAIPTSPTGLLDARIGRLSPADVALARVTAVMGRTFSSQALAAVIAGCSPTIPHLPWPEQVADGLERLVAAEWIHPIPSSILDSYDWYRFSTREAWQKLIDTTPPSHRTLVHFRLAVWLERVVETRYREWVASVASRFEAGGRPDRAAEYFRRAGQLAAEMSAPAEALRLYGRALAIGALEPSLRCKTRIGAAILREQAGDWPRAKRDLERAEREALHADRHDLLARALSLHAAIATTSGDFQAGDRLGQRALQAATQSGDVGAQADAHRARSAALTRMGHRTEAHACLQSALELDEATGDPVRLASVRASLGNLAMADGDSATAVARWTEAVELYRSLDRPLAVAGVLHSLAHQAQSEGRLADAVSAYEESLEIRRAEGDLPRQAWNLHNLSHIYRELGDHTRASTLQTREIAISRKVGNQPGVGYGLFNEGLLQEHIGDYAAARASHLASLAVFVEVGEPERQAVQHLQLARVARLLEDWAACTAHLEDATRLGADAQQLAAERVELALAEGRMDEARALVDHLDTGFEADLLRARVAPTPAAVAALVPRAMAQERPSLAIQARALRAVHNPDAGDDFDGIRLEACELCSVEVQRRLDRWRAGGTA